jgi:type IV pilus assembly protein PilP
MKISVRTIAVLLAVAVLPACTPDIAQLRVEVDQIKQTPAPPLEPIPVMKDPDRYVYQSSGMRDPFVSGEQGEDPILGSSEPRVCDGPAAPDPNRSKEPLEEFPLDSLDMVGTLAQSGSTFGLMKDPEGVVHRVLEGNRMGQNYGVITAIGEDRIVLEETMSDGNGCWESKSAEVALEDSSR